MNPYFISVIVGTALGHKRRCPACKRVKLVPLKKKREKVRCESCGADIPPPVKS